MCEALNVYEEAISKVSSAPEEKGESVKKKCDKVTASNIGLATFKKIRNILEGRNEEHFPMMNPADISSFKYAPVTSTEVERSFSMLKHLLSDRRLSFTEQNVKKMIVASCNNI